MEQRVAACPRLEGQVVPPGDKSISHRAAILNSIASGQARVDNVSPGADCLSTMGCLRGLGVEIAIEGNGVSICGRGRGGIVEPQDVLDAGNSATTMRLLAGLLAAQPFFSVITGDHSLRSRPMGRLIQPLRQMGAELRGRGGDSLAPLAIRGGTLKGIDYHPPVASAQLKSAVLIAALFAEGVTVVEEPAPSRDHTERMLEAMGAHIRRDGARIELQPGAALSPLDCRVPGDISAAAFWLVAAAIHPDAVVTVSNVGVNPSRTGILDVLRDMGARIQVTNERTEGNEPVADITARSSELVATSLGESTIPRIIDEVPIIALAASFARGTTTIRDAAELRVKESDRIATTAKELARLGAHIEELPDGMAVHGGRRLTGVVCESHGDHRLAMMLGIAALVADGETVIADAGAAAVSYPGFWRDLGLLCRT